MSTLLPTLLLLAAPIQAAEPLDLDEALQAAADRNLTLAAMDLELDQAQARLQRAQGLLLPMLQGGVQWTHMDHEETVDFGATMGSVFEDMGLPFEMGESEPMVLARQDTVSGTLGASWSVLSPRSWATLRVAREGRALTELSVAQVEQELLLATAQAWYGASTTGALVELQREQVASAEEHLSVAQKRFDAGTGVRIDVVRARTDLAAASQNLLSAELADESARDALGVLTGLGGMPEPGKPGELRLPVASDQELVEHALTRREDVRVARASVDLAQASLGSSRSAWLPSVDLAWQGSYAFTEPGEMGSDDPTRWTAVASLNVPLYSHAMVGDINEGKAALRQAQLQLEDAERQAAQAVRQALRDQHSSEAAVSLASEQAALAGEALELTQTAYAAGAGSSLEVSDARAGLVGAEINRLTTELQAELDAIVLLRALGGDMLTAVQP
jgi:outer membrane protein TolC